MQLTRLERHAQTLNWAAALMILLNLGFVFFFAPIERTMGNVQRIFYFHVGAAWVGAIAFFVALTCGVLYLRRPSQTYDIIALASVEIGLVFLTMAIVSGSVWGKPAWNAWWTWTPRLTLITIAWLTYAAYFMLRGAVEDEEKRARFSAVYVIAAFVTIILSYLSVRLLRDVHPVVVGGTLESAQGAAQGLQDFSGDRLAYRMGITLTLSVISFSVLYLAWLANRMHLQRLIEDANALKLRVAARLQGDNV